MQEQTQACRIASTNASKFARKRVGTNERKCSVIAARTVERIKALIDARKRAMMCARIDA
jgi:hypothetical protein